MTYLFFCLLFFFFNDTATTEIYTLSLHDALPIYLDSYLVHDLVLVGPPALPPLKARSEEHTSELQSRENLECRLLLEKTKSNMTDAIPEPDPTKLTKIILLLTNP